MILVIWCAKSHSYRCAAALKRSRHPAKTVCRSASVSGPTGSNGQYSAILYSRYDKTGAVTVSATAPGYGSVTFTEAVVSR